MPVTPTQILDLASLVIRVFGPLVMRIAESLSSNRDPIADLAAESPETILDVQGHLAEAMAIARAHDAATTLWLAWHESEGLGLDARQIAIVEHALSVHAVVQAHEPTKSEVAW